MTAPASSAPQSPPPGEAARDIPPNYLRYLETIDLAAFDERVQAFRDLVAINYNTPVTFETLNDVFAPTGPSSFLIAMMELREGTVLWRARAIDSVDDIQCEQDVWAPPARFAASGRLNAAGTPLLYTMLDHPSGIHREARIEDGQLYALAGYVVDRRIGVTSFSGVDPANLIPDHLIPAHLAIQSFISTEIFRPASSQRDYSVTQAFVRDYFSLPEDVTHGWIYNSVESPGATNAALRPDLIAGELHLAQVSVYVRTGESQKKLLLAPANSWNKRDAPPPWKPAQS